MLSEVKTGFDGTGNNLLGCTFPSTGPREGIQRFVWECLGQHTVRKQQWVGWFVVIGMMMYNCMVASSCLMSTVQGDPLGRRAENR